MSFQKYLRKAMLPHEEGVNVKGTGVTSVTIYYKSSFIAPHS